MLNFQHALALGTLIAALLPAQTSAATTCLLQNTAKHSNDHTLRREDGPKIEARIRRGPCEVRLDAEGPFTVRGDLSAFLRVDDGGFVELSEKHDGDTRSVRITSEQGRLDLRFSGDFDLDRSRWLAAMLLAIERHTAMFVAVRVPALLRSEERRV